MSNPITIYETIPQANWVDDACDLMMRKQKEEGQAGIGWGRLRIVKERKRKIAKKRKHRKDREKK